MASTVINFNIPEGYDFEDLDFGVDPESGRYQFKTDIIRELCGLNDLDVDQVLSTETLVWDLIEAWYREHLEHGGAPDRVFDALLQEKRLAREKGLLCHEPGHA